MRKGAMTKNAPNFTTDKIHSKVRILDHWWGARYNYFTSAVIAGGIQRRWRRPMVPRIGFITQQGTFSSLKSSKTQTAMAELDLRFSSVFLYIQTFIAIFLTFQFCASPWQKKVNHDWINFGCLFNLIISFFPAEGIELRSKLAILTKTVQFFSSKYVAMRNSWLKILLIFTWNQKKD